MHPNCNVTADLGCNLLRCLVVRGHQYGNLMFFPMLNTNKTINLANRPDKKQKNTYVYNFNGRELRSQSANPSGGAEANSVRIKLRTHRR